VVRGADHITNTAVQIQIFAALGAEPPRFAHLSLLTAPGGAALSKREGSTAVSALREEGIEAMALVAALARLGTANNIEPVADVAEAAQGFDLASFGTAPVVFDLDPIRRLSAEILHAAAFEAVATRLAARGVRGPKAEPFWVAVRPNLTRLADVDAWWQLVNEGAEPVIFEEDRDFVEMALANLPPRPWDPGTWGAWTADLRQRSGRKGAALFRPLRRALTGRDQGPEMAALMPLLEKP
jgi:glutamyl-tRNA synthetase